MKTVKRLLTAALVVLFTFMCALPAMADDVYILGNGSWAYL